MVLREEALRAVAMLRHLVHALTELREALILGNVGDLDASIRRLPARASVAGAVDTRGRHRDQHVVGIGWMRENRVQAGASATGHPLRSVGVLPQALHERETLPAVVGSKERVRLPPGVDDGGLLRARRLDLATPG